MAMSEKTRNAIYQGLGPIISKEAADEMLSYFPARDAEETVTKEHLDRRIAEVHTAIERKANTQLVWMISTITTASAAIVGLMLGVLPHLIN